MSEQLDKKYAGKAKQISEKYQFKKYENYSKAEFIALIKELVTELKAKEKIIATYEYDFEKKEAENLELKKKLNSFYNEEDNLEKFKGYKFYWTYIDKICFVLERNKKPMTSKMIVELIQKLEPELTKKLADPFNSISKAIYTGIKLERIVKTNKIGNYGFTYLLK